MLNFCSWWKHSMCNELTNWTEFLFFWQKIKTAAGIRWCQKFLLVTNKRRKSFVLIVRPNESDVGFGGVWWWESCSALMRPASWGHLPPQVGLHQPVPFILPQSPTLLRQLPIKRRPLMQKTHIIAARRLVLPSSNPPIWLLNVNSRRRWNRDVAA